MPPRMLRRTRCGTGGRRMKRKKNRFCDFVREHPGICGVIAGVILYISLTLLCRVLTDKPVLPCPNCGAPLQRDGNSYTCVQPLCGYHS